MPYADSGIRYRGFPRHSKSERKLFILSYLNRSIEVGMRSAVGVGGLDGVAIGSRLQRRRKRLEKNHREIHRRSRRGWSGEQRTNLTKGKIRALLIEEDPEDALQLLDMAHQSEYVEIDLKWERSLAEAWEPIARGCDVVLLGLERSSATAFDAIDDVRARVAHSAIVVLAGSSSRADAVLAIRRGAENHLEKDRLTPARLERVLQFAVERQQATSALRTAEAEYRGLFENALEGVYRSSPDGRLLTANPSLLRMLGYESIEELLEIDLRDLYVNPEDREKWIDRLERRGEIRNTEAVLRRRDGEPVTALETTRAVRSEDGRILYLEGSLLDITERKQYERHLEYLVSHDSLTGLLSRRRFLEDLDREVQRSRRYRTYASLLLLDLDNFKEVNDTFGHHVGDDVLTVVGRLLRKRLRQTDFVARLGGDEFAVLAPQTGAVEAQTVAAALLDTLWNNTFKADGERVRLGASVGIAVVNQESPNSETILVRADQAMYRAKSNGGRDCELYMPKGSDPPIGLRAS